MKRLFCFILAALLCVPVLAIPAAAAAVYEFEYLELPQALFDEFVVDSNGYVFLYEGIVPPGVYDLSLQVGDLLLFSVDPVELSFDQYYEDDGYWYYASVVSFTDGTVSMDIEFVAFSVDGATIFANDNAEFPEGSVLTLTRVGDLPSAVNLSGFVDTLEVGFSDFNFSVFSIIVLAPFALIIILVFAWFAYRFITGKVTKAFFKSRL